MSQPSVVAFFNTRKRAAVDELTSIKNRRLLETPTSQDNHNADPTPPAGTTTSHKNTDDIAKAGLRTTRSGRTIKRIGAQQDSADTAEVLPKKLSKIERSFKQQKLVQFVKKGPLSPRKKPPTSTAQSLNTPIEESSAQMTLKTAFTSKSNATNMERGPKIMKDSGQSPLKRGELQSRVQKELNFDEVKTKLSRSSKLQELKASLNRIHELEKTRKAQEENNRQLRKATAPKVPKTTIVEIKKFDTIELELLTSPAKTFKTPTKLPPATPDKNELMTPRHTDVSKRILFSPAKTGSASKMIVPPAYQRYASLAEKTTAGQLPLPFKYRNLIEMFKGLDSVCAMFHNRKECITFKKLKPAVQRMLRKNFTETHLAQIKRLFPEAFIFTQMKMRNYGSTSKTDYHQLVIAPNVEKLERNTGKQIDADNVLVSAQKNSMNPHVMIERFQKFQRLLLERVKEEHDKFLKSLDPPMSIPKDKVTRWHPDFDLENCPDIESGHLPQPPNVEKYSSARDILSTARNLFNCATTMERAMERYEAKVEADRVETENIHNASKAMENEGCSAQNKNETTSKIENNTSKVTTITAVAVATPAALPVIKATSANDMLLKGVPKSLLDKIRAKQAAKALDAITRRPSQDLEATKYSRLPELARHLRNVFIGEKKSVLTLEMVIKKVENSIRTSLTPQEIEAHLQLLAKEMPAWVAFHEVRKSMYLKINKELDMSKVLERLEALANAKKC